MGKDQMQGGTWFNPLVVDWMEADLNESSQRKDGRGNEKADKRKKMKGALNEKEGALLDCTTNCMSVCYCGCLIFISRSC